MASQTPIWLGSTVITETPDSPQYGHDATRFYLSRFYEGPYDACVANAPVQGNAFIDFPVAVLIVDVQIKRKPGNIGRIEVRAESQISDSNPAAPTYEVEWVEVDRPLLMNPRYAVGGSGAKVLTAQDVAMIGKWEEEDNPVLKNAFQYKVPQDNANPGAGSAAPTGTTTVNSVTFNVYTLSANAQDYAAKRLKGIESYRFWAPVARQTLETYTLPTVNPCGVIENPPSAIGVPSGYVWQRSAQRATKTGRYGRWQQQQEWQGADSIDTDLYPSA
jgi:hypothetical protein